MNRLLPYNERRRIGLEICEIAKPLVRAVEDYAAKLGDKTSPRLSRPCRIIEDLIGCVVRVVPEIGEMDPLLSGGEVVFFTDRTAVARKLLSTATRLLHENESLPEGVVRRARPPTWERVLTVDERNGCVKVSARAAGAGDEARFAPWLPEPWPKSSSFARESLRRREAWGYRAMRIAEEILVGLELVGDPKPNEVNAYLSVVERLLSVSRHLVPLDDLPALDDRVVAAATNVEKRVLGLHTRRALTTASALVKASARCAERTRTTATRSAASIDDDVKLAGRVHGLSDQLLDVVAGGP